MTMHIERSQLRQLAELGWLRARPSDGWGQLSKRYRKGCFSVAKLGCDFSDFFQSLHTVDMSLNQWNKFPLFIRQADSHCSVFCVRSRLIMAAEENARAFELSAKSGLRQPSQGYRYLSITKTGHRSKFKWLGDFDELKMFVEGYLKITGTWSYTTNNGTFHTMKAEGASVSFYPGIV